MPKIISFHMCCPETKKKNKNKNKKIPHKMRHATRKINHQFYFPCTLDENKTRQPTLNQQLHSIRITHSNRLLCHPLSRCTLSLSRFIEVIMKLPILALSTKIKLHVSCNCLDFQKFSKTSIIQSFKICRMNEILQNKYMLNYLIFK